MAVLCAPVIFFLILILTSDSASAATFSIVPSSASGSYPVGQVFSVPVLVSTSASEPVNAVSAVISFPANLLQVVSIDKTGSVVDFWVSNPSFSNTEGTVSFEGGIYNPGFSGSGGKTVSILFKAKAPGAANLSFLSSAILANDGQGSNILEKANSSSVTLVSAGKIPTDVAATVSTQSIIVNSSTHPDSTKWYNRGAVSLSWNLPAGANAVRISYDKNPSSLPTVLYTPAIASKQLSLKDGVWYFHIQARDNDGWGPVTHFKIQIDTVAPNIPHISFPHGTSANDPRPVVLFNTTDELSGIDYYSVDIGGKVLMRIEKEVVSSNPYVMPIQDPGEHDVKVIAYDKAGNQASDESAFEVVGIQDPSFDDFPRELTQGDTLQFSGITYPNATVSISIKSGNGDTVTQSTIAGGFAGRFLLVWTKYLVAGDYIMTAQATDEHGAKSSWTPEVKIKIKTPALTRIGLPILNFLTLGIILVGAVAALIAWTWYMMHHLRKLKKKLRSKVKKADQDIHDRFKKISASMATHSRSLEKAAGKRDLTAEEKKIFDSIKKMLVDAEEDIEKEVEEIDR